MPARTQPSKFKFKIATRSRFDPRDKIMSVVYPVSRYGKYYGRMTFTEPITEKTAIALVECVLSELLTEQEFERVKDDTAWHGLNWEDMVVKPKMRGTLLGDMVFVEGLNTREGVLTFNLGS